MQWRDGTTVINTVRATSSEKEAVRLRLRLSNLLEMVAFRPASLAPASILCIRSLYDPLPQQLPINTIRPIPQWEQAVRNHIDKLVREAERPSHGAVSSQAQAVLFVDRAELMACLAKDWFTGQALNRWWWRGLLRNQSVADAVLRTWLDSVAYVPHALETLTKISNVSRFVDQLSSSDITVLLDGVLKAHQLTSLRQAISAPLTADEISGPFSTGTYSTHSMETFETEHQQAAGGAGEETPFTVDAHLPSTPWASIVPESMPYKDNQPAQLLLGIALSIVRAPSIIRKTAFTRQTRRWVIATVRKQVKQDTNETHDTLSTSSQTPQGAIKPDTSDVLIEVDPIIPEQEQPDTIYRHEDTTLQPSDRTETRDKPSEPKPSAQPHKPRPNPSDRFHMEQPYTYENGVEPLSTRLGGIFYLLNVGIYLELYSDLSQPETVPFALNIWNFVALISRKFLGDRHQDDPVWRFLAHLADREETDEPDHDFIASENWQMPIKWLDSIPDTGIWTIDEHDGRLQVWHPMGFCVLDSGDMSLEQCLNLYAIADYQSRNQPRRTYLQYLTDYIQVRLQLALDDPADLAERLLIHDARIYVTDTHLDVVMSLEALPIDIRLAGLDRDPGWIPSAGKTTRFHFE